MRRVVLPVSPLSAESFAPYGHVLSAAGARDAGRDGYDIWIGPSPPRAGRGCRSCATMPGPSPSP